MLDDRLLGVNEILGHQRVCGVVRERPVEIEEESDDVEVAAAQDGFDGVTGHPVAGVDDDLESALGCGGHEAGQLVGVALKRVELLELPGGFAAEVEGRGKVTQACHEVGGDGACVFEAELDAVVLGGIVAGGELDTGEAGVARSEPQLVSGCEAEHDHVGAGDPGALRERQAEFLAHQAHVAAEDEFLGAGQFDETGTEYAGPFDIPFWRVTGHDSADVVGFEDLFAEHGLSLAITVNRGPREAEGFPASLRVPPVEGAEPARRANQSAARHLPRP